jgi:hypothetical protein
VGPVFDDFSAALGERFQVEADGATLTFVLEEARELPHPVREKGSFRLQFRGPADPVLPQAIYRFARGGDAWDLFIVPSGRDGEGATYEVTFN